MDFSRIYDQAILKAKIEALEEEVTRLTKENNDLRASSEAPASDQLMKTVKIATEAAAEDFRGMIDSVYDRMDKMEKTFAAEIKFRDLVDNSTECFDWYKKNKQFVLNRIIDGDMVSMTRIEFSLKFTRDNTTLTINFKSFDDGLTMVVNEVRIDGRNVKSLQPEGNPKKALIDIPQKLHQFVDICFQWASKLRDYASTAGKLVDELAKNQIIKQ